MSDTEDAEADPQPEELTIEIDPPIVIKGATYSTLHLREPRATEVQQAEAAIGSVATVASLRRYQMIMVSKVSGWPLAALDQLPIRKLEEAGEFCAGFIGGGRRTGQS